MCCTTFGIEERKIKCMKKYRMMEYKMHNAYNFKKRKSKEMQNKMQVTQNQLCARHCQYLALLFMPLFFENNKTIKGELNQLQVKLIGSLNDVI